MSPLLLLVPTLLLLLLAGCHGNPAYIIGGHDSEVGRHPWQGSLIYFNDHFCGASLISRNWAVTAGHCIMDEPPQGVVFGMHAQNDASIGDPVHYDIAKVIKHPRYKKGWGYQANDIALLQLSTSVMFGPYVAPISLPKQGQNYFSKKATITGWGVTHNEENPMVLQEAEVSIHEDRYCSPWRSHFNPDFHVCTSNPGISIACHADSGGPLSYHDLKTDSYVLVGIASWVQPDCSPDMPGVYLKVAFYRDWIREQTGV